MSFYLLSRQWIKTSSHPLAQLTYKCLLTVRNPEIPAPGIVVKPLYGIYQCVNICLSSLTRIFWWTPLLKGRVKQVGSNLYLYGGLPYFSGPLETSIGNDCRVSGQSTFSGRTAHSQVPQLIVGNNVDIGWMTTIAVGNKVILGDNVRIAGRAFLAGYPGHPLDAKDRALGLPETDDQVGDIVLEPDVWLATGVSVMAGVTIGKGTIVAAGSVVTHDPMSLS